MAVERRYTLSVESAIHQSICAESTYHGIHILSMQPNDVIYIPDAIPVSEDLNLRAARLDDASELFRVVNKNRKFLRKHLPWLDDTNSVSDETDFILDQSEKANRMEAMLLLLEYENEIVGTLSINRIDHGNRTAWIGYWLDQDHCGNGLMTRSAGALIDVLLNACAFHRVVIEAGIDNLPSRAIPERLGFREEGVSVEREWLYDHWIDIVQYAITAREWNTSD
ncbi:MAG: RimJ/RimL family protein N-acetyltransferase [Euryarchaeota archaeon]|nr:RimJ/RimL family protein N-acetyltransferase [Euryarchaeota archaeon]